MATRNDIMSYYPYETPRLGHEETLRAVENMWDNFDVALIVAPPGMGKTALRRAIAYWTGDAAMLVPSNALILQELDAFPDTVKILNRKDFYRCDHCYDMDLARATTRGQPVLCVPHMLVARRLGRRVLIVDEAHTLLQTNSDLQSIHAWRRDIKYPLTTYSRDQLENYLQLNPTVKNRDKLLAKLRTNDYVVKREQAAWRGRDMDRMRIIPLSPEFHRSLSAGSKKIILMSATISKEDVADLGAARNKRILQIEVPSPIPAANRPLVRSYVGGMSFNNLTGMSPIIAKRIQDIANFHTGEKGIIHVTYGLARILREHLTSSRYIWHTAQDAKSQLAYWMGTRDGILMASGMEEGLDLKGPEYRWQILAKIPWTSLADVAVRKKAEGNQSWYIWQTLKKVMQAYGRICRSEVDEGTSYVLDSTLERLISEGRKYNLIPKWFEEVL